MNPGNVTRNLGKLATAGLLGASLLATTSLAFAQNQTMGAGSNASSPPAATSAAPAAPKAAPKAAVRHTPAAVETRIKRLHDELKITAAETDQWNSVAGIMRDNEKQISDLIAKRSSSTASMTAVDNLQNYADITGAHEDGLRKLIPAFQKLYDSMSDAQKKTADTVFRQRGQARATAKAPSKG
jgi:periplasmic protein CpxP/Spy